MESLEQLKMFFKDFKFVYDDGDFFNDLKSEKRNNDSKINLDCIPTPFLGKIENPDVIVLALNPSYDKLQDEMDKQFLDYKKINDFYEFLTKIDVFSINDEAKRFPFTVAWWRSIFDGIDINGKKIGMFNLMCYHSKHYPTTSKKKLKSQECVIEYINNLLKEKPELPVIFVWGKTYWDEFIGKNLEGHVIYELNEGSKTNKFINKSKKYEEIKKLFSESNS